MVDAIDLMVGIIGGRGLNHKRKIGNFGGKNGNFVVNLWAGGLYWG
jgi:hypothetical protein